MTVPQWVKRAAFLKGHAVDAEWLWTVQWMLGVIGIFFALLIGIFVSLGGAEHLTGALYIPLLESFHDYHVIGAVNIIGGILGVIGLATDRKGFSIASASICSVWNGLLALFTIPANWTIPGGGNVIGLYGALAMLLYLSRVVLLIVKPRGDTVKLR